MQVVIVFSSISAFCLLFVTQFLISWLVTSSFASVYTFISDVDLILFAAERPRHLLVVLQLNPLVTHGLPDHTACNAVGNQNDIIGLPTQVSSTSYCRSEGYDLAHVESICYGTTRARLVHFVIGSGSKH